MSSLFRGNSDLFSHWSRPITGNCDLFYLPTVINLNSGVDLRSAPVQDNFSGDLAQVQVSQAIDVDNTAPVHLPNTLVPNVDWDPRTLEGVLTLVCPYPQAKEELFTIRDFGSLIITYAETGPRGVFDEDLELLITFSNILRDKYYLRGLIGGDHEREAVNLDVTGKVTIT